GTEGAESAIDVDAPTVARAPGELVAVVYPAAAIARIDVAQLGGEVEAAPGGRVDELRAADPRLVDVDAHALPGRRRVGEHDQVVDPALEDVEGPTVVGQGLRQTHVEAGGFLRFQPRAFRAGIVEVVEGGCLETGADRRVQADAAGERESPAQAAGHVAAELLVVVVADAGLHVVGAGTAVVADEH